MPLPFQSEQVTFVPRWRHDMEAVSPFLALHEDYPPMTSLLNNQSSCCWSQMSQYSRDITVRIYFYLFPVIPVSWWRQQMETFYAYWSFVRGIHLSPVSKSPHKGQWRGALTFSSICAWANVWANHRDAGDLRHHLVHYDVIVMYMQPHQGRD